MGKLILVCHGHTCLNVPGRNERLGGWLDLPLDDQGLKEAAETAERLADYPVEATYSSDLRRARQTAVTDILPFLNLLNQQPDLAAPSGESFYQFYGLTDLMNLASESQGCIVAVTHVRNVLASQTMIEHGDRVPVCGVPPTGTLIVVEK
jgi:phosphohistidine phosphatase SixA